MKIEDLKTLLAKPRLQIGEIVCSLAMTGSWSDDHTRLIADETLKRFSKMADECGFSLQTDAYESDLRFSIHQAMTAYYNLSREHSSTGLFITDSVAGVVVASPPGNKYNPLPWINKEYRR